MWVGFTSVYIWYSHPPANLRSRITRQRRATIFFSRISYFQSMRNPLRDVHKISRVNPVYVSICGKNQIQNRECTWHCWSRVMLQNWRHTFSNQYLVNKESVGIWTRPESLFIQIKWNEIAILKISFDKLWKLGMEKIPVKSKPDRKHILTFHRRNDSTSITVS